MNKLSGAAFIVPILDKGISVYQIPGKGYYLDMNEWAELLGVAPSTVKSFVAVGEEKKESKTEYLLQLEAVQIRKDGKQPVSLELLEFGIAIMFGFLEAYLKNERAIKCLLTLTINASETVFDDVVKQYENEHQREWQKKGENRG